MKFLVDAQLPKRLADWLRSAGHDAVHVSALPKGNATPDSEVSRFADAEGRVVVTKDADFVDSHLLRGAPALLLLVSTGNLGNPELLALTQSSIADIEREFAAARFLELDSNGLIVRG